MRADHQKVIRNLNIAKGQIEGIINMIKEDRYCLDIYDQINATRAILARVNSIIMEEHLKTCVKEAILRGDDSKIDEALNAIKKGR